MVARLVRYGPVRQKKTFLSFTQEKIGRRNLHTGKTTPGGAGTGTRITRTNLTTIPHRYSASVILFCSDPLV